MGPGGSLAEDDQAAGEDVCPFHGDADWQRLIDSGRPPTDRLSQTVAGLVQRDGPARDLLTAGIYLPTENEDPAWRLDRALALADTSQGLRRRVRSAGWEEVAEASMSGEGESLLAQYETLVREIIQVDDFPANLAAAESTVNESDPRSAG